jgi:hypothetical protein
MVGDDDARPVAQMLLACDRRIVSRSSIVFAGTRRWLAIVRATSEGRNCSRPGRVLQCASSRHDQLARARPVLARKDRVRTNWSIRIGASGSGVSISLAQAGHPLWYHRRMDVALQMNRGSIRTTATHADFFLHGAAGRSSAASPSGKPRYNQTHQFDGSVLSLRVKTISRR